LVTGWTPAGAKYVGRQSNAQLVADVNTVSRNRTDGLQEMHSGHCEEEFA
jgi:hypothetical protein